MFGSRSGTLAVISVFAFLFFVSMIVLFVLLPCCCRLYSRFLFDYSRSKLLDMRDVVETKRAFRTPKMFHEFVLDGLQKYRACFQHFSLRHCIYNRTLWESVHSVGVTWCVHASALPCVRVCVWGGGGGAREVSFPFGSSSYMSSESKLK